MREWIHKHIATIEPRRRDYTQIIKSHLNLGAGTGTAGNHRGSKGAYAGLRDRRTRAAIGAMNPP